MTWIISSHCLLLLGGPQPMSFIQLSLIYLVKEHLTKYLSMTTAYFPSDINLIKNSLLMVWFKNQARSSRDSINTGVRWLLESCKHRSSAQVKYKCQNCCNRCGSRFREFKRLTEVNILEHMYCLGLENQTVTCVPWESLGNIPFTK